VEYTNEYWTTIFDQHPYLIQQGAEKFGDVPFANAQAYGARASEMAQIFKQVFGSDGARLYPTVTLNHSAFNSEEAITMLTTPAYTAQGGQSPLQAGIRHLATDGYLYWGSTDPATAALIDQWIANPATGFAAARDYLTAQLNDDLAPAWVKGRALADLNNLSFGIYEGGALLLNGDFAAPGPERFTQFNKDVQLSPEMREVYEATLAAWQSTGSAPFAWYADTGRAGSQGDYGLWNAPDFIPELRTEAIIAANQDVNPWWTSDTRPASTFDNGKYDAGTEANDFMSGTRLDDRLYGLTGNDTLFGDGGNDRLVGGGGIDVLAGGTGNDLMYGGALGDTLLMDDYANPGATNGADTGYGEAGNDLLWGYGGNDALYGGDDNDTVVGNDFGSSVNGNDQLYGGPGADILFTGLGGNAYMDGGAGNDRFYGGAIADILRGGTGSDFLFGSGGADRFLFHTADLGNGDADVVYFIDATDRLQFSAGLNGALSFQNLAALEYAPGLFTTGVSITASLGGGQTATITVYGTTVAGLMPLVDYAL
jgi:hypothetical protein